MPTKRFEQNLVRRYENHIGRLRDERDELVGILREFLRYKFTAKPGEPITGTIAKALDAVERENKRWEEEA